jgi:hypothetical protein
MTNLPSQEKLSGKALSLMERIIFKIGERIAGTNRTRVSINIFWLPTAVSLIRTLDLFFHGGAKPKTVR